MAIPFLNNISLNNNEIQNVKLHNTANIPSPGTGHIYFDTDDSIAKYWNGSSWVNIVSNTNDYLTSLSFNTTDGVLTATVQNQSNVTVDLDGRYALDSDIPATIVETVSGGTYITNSGTASDVVLDHDDTSRTDTTSTDAPGYGGTFEAVTSVTTNTTGHVTAIDVSTVTIPASETITLTGEVTGSGTTSISTTVADGVLDVANFNANAIVVENEGIENIYNDTTLPTSAAVKAYVDEVVAGGLIYQSGYNAATNTPDLDSSPSSSIKKGWTYTVTADGSFFTEQVRVGDVLISEVDSPTALADWTTVQNNIDLASSTQIGIGNVVQSTAADKTGIDVSYSGGTATVGFNIDDITQVSSLNFPDDSFIPFWNEPDGENQRISSQDLALQLSGLNSKAFTITDTATVTHNLGRDVIIQLYDNVTFETVYADVDRISTSQATITFATTPTNSIRVLVQKIG